MENPIKFSITVLEEERFVPGSDFTDEEKTKFIESLEAKYGGEIELIETRVFTPLLKKDGKDKPKTQPEIRVSPIVRTSRRTKPARPTRSRCIRWLRTLQTRAFRGPIPVASGDAPDTLFWTLRRAGAFFAEDNIARCIKSLKRKGYSVQEESLPTRKANETRYCQCILRQGQPVCRIIRKLSLQDNEAMMSVRLVIHPQTPSPLTWIFQVAQDYDRLLPWEIDCLLSDI